VSPQATLLLRYEHVVRLNDDSVPVPALSRVQVWNALAERAQSPGRYDDAIGACKTEQHARGWRRRYDRLGTTIEDEARLKHDVSVTFITRAPAEFRGSKLSITIDEPGVGTLFLRFSYELRGTVPAPGERECAALRIAYHHADLEFVRRLRLLTAS
jgi:hypothetical protein